MVSKYGDQQEKWLMDDDNLLLWQGDLSASQRRILMTQWVGEAVEIVNKDVPFLRRCFERTGCLVDITGDDDHKICIEGIDNYTFR